MAKPGKAPPCTHFTEVWTGQAVRCWAGEKLRKCQNGIGSHMLKMLQVNE